jgi:hypothetical protein
MDHPRVYRSASDGKYYKQADSRVFEAQMIAPGDISAIEAVTILDEVLGLARPQYVLRNVCRPVRMDSLTARVDIATALAGKEKVPPLVEAEIVAEAYTDVDFDLWKNVVHVAISDEAIKKAAHDILGLHVSDAARDLARMENKQIDEALDGATDVAGTDWGDTTKNPYADIVGVMATIEGNGYPVDSIVAHPLVWGDFFGNPFVKGQLQGQVMPGGRIFDVPGLPGVRGYSDFACLNTVAFVLSTSAPALVLGEGPVEAARYRDEKAGYDAYIIRQWLQPKLVLAGAIRELTGVHA